MAQINILHVMPGYYCNFSCDHCCNESGPEQKGSQLTSEEVERLCRDIKEFKPATLMFSGGEPTFYIRTINTLIESHPELETTEIHLTTNGWFGETEEKAGDVLDKFTKVDWVQISYDKFHGSHTELEKVKNIIRVCQKRDIGCNVSISLTEPLDLINVQGLQEELGVQITYQTVQNSGRAKSTDSGYKYTFFENEILGAKCPSLGQISFIPGKGYSVCCSNLTFNGLNDLTCHDSPQKHFESSFYKKISTQDFNGLVNEEGVELKNPDSSLSAPCNLCEHIFTHNRKEVWV